MNFVRDMAVVAVAIVVGVILGGFAGGLAPFLSTRNSDPVGFLEKAFVWVPIGALPGGIAPPFVLGALTKR